jgi:uncharacterized Zn finger protein (UPF0148 family)
MEIRGERECTECGTRWSYYETGSVRCPECGSIRSVGVGERARHTDQPVELDLSDARTIATEQSIRDAAEVAGDEARSYVTSRGFIHAGDLRPLDWTYVAAQELHHAARMIAVSMVVDEDEEYYFLQLLDGAPAGERPDANSVPPSLRAARGLGAAAAVRAYRSELRTYLEDVETVEMVQELLERLDAHTRRVRALDGELDPNKADRLIVAARAIGEYLREGTETDVATAQSALDALEAEP